MIRSPLRILHLILFKNQINVKPMCLCVASRNRDGMNTQCVIEVFQLCDGENREKGSRRAWYIAM